MEWAPGLNLLEPVGTDASTHGSKVLDAIKCLFEQQNVVMPFLEKWTPASTVPLILKHLTLAEVERFASPNNRTLAFAIFDILRHELKAEGKELTEVNLEAYENRWNDLSAFR